MTSNISEKCISVAGYLLNLCAHHSLEISIVTGVIVFHIVGIWYLGFSMILWIALSGLDLLIGSAKAKRFKEGWDSRIFGKSIIKRAFIFAMGGVITIICRHLSTLFDDAGIKTIISIIPIGYFHLFSFQEFGSLLEHWIDIDPNNRVTKLIRAIYDGIKAKIVSQADSFIRKYTDHMYDYLSPVNGKKYLNR